MVEFSSKIAGITSLNPLDQRVNRIGLGDNNTGNIGAIGNNGKPREGFAAVFDKAIGKIDGLQLEADSALGDLASGKSADLHGTMIALQKADISLRAAVAVRDKLLASYEKIMNMGF